MSRNAAFSFFWTNLNHLRYKFLLVASLTSYIKAMRYAKALRDGGSNNLESLAEAGGPRAWLARLMGHEVPRRERTWGLPSRPAPPLVPESSRPLPSISTAGIAS